MTTTQAPRESQRAASEIEHEPRGVGKRWDAIWWGGACIWTGLTLGAQAFDVLPEIAGSSDWWPWLFIGLGPWSLLLNLIRLGTDAPDPSTSDWVWTVLFVAAAVGSLVDATATAVGAAALIGIGLVVLLRALTSPR